MYIVLDNPLDHGALPCSLSKTFVVIAIYARKLSISYPPGKLLHRSLEWLNSRCKRRLEHHNTKESPFADSMAAGHHEP